MTSINQDCCRSQLNTIQRKVDAIEAYIAAKNFYNRQKQLNDELDKDNLNWSSKDTVNKQREKKATDKFLCSFEDIRADLELTSIMFDDDVMNYIPILTQRVNKLYIETMLSGVYDRSPCFINISAGSGGTEAQDWASMLFNMYHQFGNRGSNYKTTVMEYTSADDAGIKSAVIKYEPNELEFPYGMLKGETGTHRLVRQSPFNANGNRHTSFASIQVVPVIEDEIPEIVFSPSDLRIDTYRASGAGGQHVNKTDSAVRITHIPTGLVAQSQNDRSQHRNKDTAMTILRSKIFALYEARRKENAKNLAGDRIPASWGSQIRSYILDSSRIKDLRTGLESTRPTDILSGDLQQFLDRYIEWSCTS